MLKRPRQPLLAADALTTEAREDARRWRVREACKKLREAAQLLQDSGYTNTGRMVKDIALDVDTTESQK